MSNKIQVITDRSGNNVFPITHEKAVRDSNGVSLETKLDSLESKTYVEAWDGVSTPVVANIPAGVTVTYSGTTYTGTLAASASTDGKVYLVKNGTEYDRYFSSQNLAGNYVWSNLGTTGMDLSDYAMKDEVSQLQQETTALSVLVEPMLEYDTEELPEADWMSVGGFDQYGGGNADTVYFDKRGIVEKGQVIRSVSVFSKGGGSIVLYLIDPVNYSVVTPGVSKTTVAGVNTFNSPFGNTPVASDYIVGVGSASTIIGMKLVYAASHGARTSISSPAKTDSNYNIGIAFESATINNATVDSVKEIQSVTPLPAANVTPTDGWGEKNYNNSSGTDGIFWDVRNKIGPSAKLLTINLISNSAGTVRVHYIDSSYNTVLYEDHEVVAGNNSFSPSAQLDYTQLLFVGFQNISSAVRLVYPTDGSGQTKKKFINDGHIIDQTLPYAFWLNVESLEGTLPYRVSELEKQVGITTLEELKAAISTGIHSIVLGDADITLDATLVLSSGVKITGIRGRSILRVPSGVLKGIEISNVEDVVIENITIIGAYNGTPTKSGLQPVRSGIVDTAEHARTFYNAGYQTDLTNGGVTSTYVPQIGINIRQCEKVEIIGCVIKDFSFYGIANALSGKNYRYAMKVQNNYINNCYCGLYLYKEAERAQYFANNIALCQIGVYLDSGTNMFTGNALTANRVGLFMNNGVNHAHGVQTGNAFTHCSLFSLYAYNIQNGEVFSQCKFGYCDAEEGNNGGFAVVLENSRGLSFQNCQCIQCSWFFNGKFYLSYSGYTEGSADQFGNTNYVVSYTDISGQPSQKNGGVNAMLGCEYTSDYGGVTLSSDLDETNVILKNNFVIDGTEKVDINN